jgi:hypothetical protein
MTSGVLVPLTYTIVLYVAKHPHVARSFKISIVSQFVKKFRSSNGISRVYSYVFAKFLSCAIAYVLKAFENLIAI